MKKLVLILLLFAGCVSQRYPYEKIYFLDKCIGYIPTEKASFDRAIDEAFKTDTAKVIVTIEELMILQWSSYTDGYFIAKNNKKGFYDLYERLVKYRQLYHKNAIK